MGIVENTYAELKQQELKNNPYSCLHMTWLFVWMKRIVTMPQHQRKRLII